MAFLKLYEHFTLGKQVSRYLFESLIQIIIWYSRNKITKCASNFNFGKHVLECV